jgi:PqqD family protein of HPr-rel-A system
MTDQPLRAEGIEINPVSDGYVVYDPSRDRVHYLNHTAALVLELCNGEHASADMARILREAYDLEEFPEESVQACIEQLRAEGLIELASTKGSRPSG